MGALKLRRSAHSELTETGEFQRMAIRHYTLSIATLAATRVPQRLVSIPAGETVRVNTDDLEVGGRVFIEWNGMLATMFADDLMSRATQKLPSEGKVAT